MADDSGGEKTSTHLQAVTHKKRSLWRPVVAIALGSLVIMQVESPLFLKMWRNKHPSSGWLIPLGLTVVGLLALLALWKLPEWQLEQVHGLEPKERFDRVNEARKTLATILGGVVLLAGFFGTWENLKVAQEAASTSQKALLVSQENQITSQKALLVSQEGQITDRFTKAIEQLGATDPKGNQKLDVRLGGNYSLERIANDSEKDHWPIIEVLCTYVRVHAPVQLKQLHQAKQTPTEQPSMSPDIQAILTVLARRNRSYEKPTQFLNLMETDLRRADLRSADLSGANLWSADLRGARLMWADLRGGKPHVDRPPGGQPLECRPPRGKPHRS